jgi:hypothetical protein
MGNLMLVVVEECAAWQHVFQVLREGLRFIADHNLVLVAPGGKTIFVDPDGIPGRQSLNVGWEQVLPGNRDAHLEQRA